MTFSESILCPPYGNAVLSRNAKGSPTRGAVASATERLYEGQRLLCPTSPSMLRIATSPSRGGLGIPQSFASSPEAPLLGELAGASPTERLDGRRTARRSISLSVIEIINFHSTTFYHTFPLATRLNGRKTAKTGRKVEKMRGNHSAAAPQSHKTLGKNARISKNTITAWM